MSNTYTGSATGIDPTTTVAITEPADGDDLNAAAFNAAYSKLTDLVAYLLLNGTFRNTDLIGSYFQTGKLQIVREVLLGLLSPMPLELLAKTLGNTGTIMEKRCTLISLPGQSGKQDQSIWIHQDQLGYTNISSDCFWDEAAGKWHRSAGSSGTRRASMLEIGRSLTLYLKGAGATTDSWFDGVSGSGWDQQFEIDLSTLTQGQIVGSVDGVNMLVTGGLGAAAVREGLHIIGDPGEIGFQNAWVQGGSGLTKAGYFVDAFGVCHLQGSIKSDNNTVAFLLPFVPAAGTNRVSRFVVADAAGTISVVDVLSSSGGVTQVFPAGSGLSHAIFLDGISFAV